MKRNRLIGLSAGALICTGSAAQMQPNILLFLVDDMGWQETSVPFYSERTPLNDRYHTPNMERLAHRGVKFMEAYACAISSPSRCSLLSGMNAARHRVTNWTLRYDEMTDMKDPDFAVPDWNYNGIQPDTVSSDKDRKNTTLITALPQLLKDNGYHTIHCGKAHFGAQHTAGADPRSFGFEVNIAGAANGGPASYLATDNFGTGDFHVEGLEAYHGKNIFLTEALTQEAIKALKEHIQRNDQSDQKKPFFLYMSHYAIHIPYDADPRFTPNYREANGEGKMDRLLGQRLSNSEISHAALIEGMDKSLGDLMDFLDERPDVAANTIILFMSDNGGQAIGPRQGRHNYDQNFPARGGKGSALLGGIREPMIVSWPGVTQGGTTNESRVMIEDFFPTLLDMAGIRHYRTSQTIDGKSFAPILRKGKRQADRQLIWHYPNLWTDGIYEADGYGPYSAIMRGDYQLIYFYKTGHSVLYNIRTDISQTHDLAAEKPRLHKRMLRRLWHALEKVNAQIPPHK